jgi:hypothetical protein
MIVEYLADVIAEERLASRADAGAGPFGVSCAAGSIGYDA